MALTVKVNGELSQESWQEFLSKNSFANPFQSPEGLEYLRKLDTMDVDVHAVSNDNDEVLALVVVTVQKEDGIKKHFSSRGIVYAGPLLGDYKSAALLLSHLISYYKKTAIYLETRNFFDYSEYKDLFAQHGWSYVPWLNFHLTTDEEAPMRKRMSSSRLRQVKKGIKNGATWREPKSVNEVQDFYEILRNLYENKIKKPLPKWDFFDKFYTSTMGKYLLIEFEGQIIGGIMCPILEGQAIYEWYIAGKDQEFRDQYPSVLATYAAMDYGLNEGLKYFDFMGAGAADEDYGVRDFKARFGGDEVEHGRFLLILNKSKYSLGKTGLKILAKIKK